jgi:hypothetical protein
VQLSEADSQRLLSLCLSLRPRRRSTRIAWNLPKNHYATYQRDLIDQTAFRSSFEARLRVQFKLWVLAESMSRTFFGQVSHAQISGTHVFEKESNDPSATI